MAVTKNVLSCCAAVLALIGAWRSPAGNAPPADFPAFVVPGHEQEMAALRELFWVHYPGAGPKATLWDEWLPQAALWPAVDTDDRAKAMRRDWRQVLSGRLLDPEGYVATHQHASIAHQLGWPFPFWNQGRHGCGWHFSFKNTAPAGWRPGELSKTNGWGITGASDGGVGEDGWQIKVQDSGAILTAPPWTCDTFEAPFLQLRWRVSGVGNSQPFIAWRTPGQQDFVPEQRMYFDPPKDETTTYDMVPMYRHPQWTGEVAQLRIVLGNLSAGDVVFQAFFSQYDTRHNINGQNFVRGCARYFWWTRDLSFLRDNIQRMRAALSYIMTEHQALGRKAVYTTWVGHDGRSGLRRLPDGKKEIIAGRGIGNNYWDLLPFGNLDCYASIQYYDALRTFIALEREIKEHPEWQIPKPGLQPDVATLEQQAVDIKESGNRLFWNADTGRFVACIDADGQGHDYGFTFLNCEAVAYDFATPEHARAILDWLEGKRIVEDDTAKGSDIYHWRFGPRATTRRNLDWYFWAWNNPESIPWGNQVQDGGAVLGFAYHDLLARLKVLGPDNAWRRLREMLQWFEEVQSAGGYRKYYDGTREGTLQGAGTPGGLGLDKEFFESVLVPQIMLYGFLGFQPRADGFNLQPQLPSDWPELKITRIRFQDSVLSIRVGLQDASIEILNDAKASTPIWIRIPPGNWRQTTLGSNGEVGESRPANPGTDGAVRVDWAHSPGVRFERNSR